MHLIRYLIENHRELLSGFMISTVTKNMIAKHEMLSGSQQFLHRPPCCYLTLDQFIKLPPTETSGPPSCNTHFNVIQRYFIYLSYFVWDTDVSVLFIKLQTGLSQDQVSHIYVGPDLGSSLLAIL